MWKKNPEGKKFVRGCQLWSVYNIAVVASLVVLLLDGGDRACDGEETGNCLHGICLGDSVDAVVRGAGIDYVSTRGVRGVKRVAASRNDGWGMFNCAGRGRPAASDILVFIPVSGVITTIHEYGGRSAPNEVSPELNTNDYAGNYATRVTNSDVEKILCGVGVEVFQFRTA